MKFIFISDARARYSWEEKEKVSFEDKMWITWNILGWKSQYADVITAVVQYKMPRGQISARNELSWRKLQSPNEIFMLYF